MVRCSTCSFRCHLYCFSPPLKQHPGFLLRKQQQNSQSDTSPIWKCEKCEGTSVVFNVGPSIEVTNTDSGWMQPVQPQWIESSKVVFDCRSGVDDLVFYSKSYAVMKKTTAIWRTHVMRRRRHRYQQELEIKALRFYDKKLNVMHVPQPNEKLTVRATQEEEFEEDDENLVSINYYIPYSRRRPRLPLLWKGEPPSALMCWTTGERVEMANVIEELVERLCLASEDIDAPLLQIQDNSFVRRRLRRRRNERANRRRRAREEARRRARARASVSLLRTCIQFIVVLMKLLGQARTKKSMLLALRDAAEETRVKNDVMIREAKDSEATRLMERQRKVQLAEVRIRRFFVRRVYPYVKIKKHVMARRLQRFWKSTYYPYKWRDAAITARLAHRNKASIQIQKFYRSSRVRKRFQALIEANARRKLRRTLTRWLLSRLAKKEAKRCAVYEAAQLASTDDNTLPDDASLDGILEKRGVELHQQGDFWNAASILERLWQMRDGKMTLELQKTLAYSHHMTWYTSYDQLNLSRAHELYCNVLESCTPGKRVDPLVLQDVAIVMMHMEHFGDSLRLLAKLIEYFARHPQFPLWLLLAAVELQQLGEWEQSVEYLTYLHDIPPPPYVEGDILALAAMGYEQLAIVGGNMSEERTSNTSMAREAWRAALRQWNLEKVNDERPSSAAIRGNGRVMNSKEKWDLLTNLGKRALEQGHFLLACRVYLYALERVECSDQEKHATWWNLADAFRHLGHQDLFLNAARRSQPNATEDDELPNHWQELAEQQTCSFQTDLKTLTVLQKLRQLNGNTK
ncbi:uncharacterized protein PITG_09984 [Phytophthora infestans T30-4]|uniref:Uncharacterized protein n=1 Tax=Phytophthora infestans (strain T30-4) TaxID=403677 RepID=D0NE01_PHYIT|nr:uncharacterized protein PITG_09984 [Phytophthora infestans T30-4]EEY56446.1 hypothetical protein PITG_09984 [Phytophthora infestans T30-4]|eukprot:XP_002902520.1 hypothetical protein PITG_09984 [Phytophthora infestans T30-4]